jgi:hypothetical protein
LFSEALRLNKGKPKLDYILHLPKSVELLARIFEFGSEKYEDMNWAKGGKSDTEYLGAALRHLLKWANGEVFDEESGCNHLGHIIWNFMVLMDLNHPDEVMDSDRFNKAITYWKEQKSVNKPATP